MPVVQETDVSPGGAPVHEGVTRQASVPCRESVLIPVHRRNGVRQRRGIPTDQCIRPDGREAEWILLEPVRQTCGQYSQYH